jgi:hypothetical protein
MIRQLLRSWWEGLKELSQPGGYQRRYNRYYEQMNGSPPPVPKQTPVQQRPSHHKRKKLTLKKVNRGLSRVNRGIKRLNKPFHAKGAKRGLKY